MPEIRVRQMDRWPSCYVFMSRRRLEELELGFSYKTEVKKEGSVLSPGTGKSLVPATPSLQLATVLETHRESSSKL